MERLVRGVTFWGLLVVFLFPAVAQGQQLKSIKKCLYTAKVATDDGSGRGSSQLVVTGKLFDGSTRPQIDFDYIAKSTVTGVEKVTLVSPYGSVVLCDNAGTEDCATDDTGLLFISGRLTDVEERVSGCVTSSPVGAAQCLQIKFNDSALGSGTYVLAQQCSFRQF